MSQADLASATRTNQTTISQYERAVTRPSLDTVVALEEALGLRRGSLLVAAGYVEVGAPVTVEDAIREDPGIDDIAREYLLALLARARTRHRSATDAA